MHVCGNGVWLAVSKGLPPVPLQSDRPWRLDIKTPEFFVFNPKYTEAGSIFQMLMPA
jgi:hypothetical protein